jgi:hypothetical protein
VNFTLAVMSRSAGKGDCSLILYSTTMVFLCQRTNPTCNAYYWCVFQVQNSASLVRTGVICLAPAVNWLAYVGLANLGPLLYQVVCKTIMIVATA